MTTPEQTPVDTRTGDKPSETPGHVIPGQDLRARLNLAPKPVEKHPEKKEESVVPAAPTPPAKNPANGRFIKKPKVIAAPVVVAPAFDVDAATTIVTAAVKTALAKPEPAAIDPLTGLTAQQKKRLTVIQHMETMNPVNKGKGDAYVAAAKKLATYQSEWEANPENKGKRFNVDDEEHELFMVNNDVDIDPDEFNEAMADMRADEKTKAAMKPIEERFKLEDENKKLAARAAEVAPTITTHAKATALTLFGQLGDVYKGVLDQGGTVVPAEVKRLLDENPVNEEIFKIAQQTETVASELMRIATGVSQFNDKLPLHVHIAEFAINQDAEMMKLPQDQRYNDGKLFAAMDEWNKLTPKQRETRWHLTDVDLSTLYAVEQADRAKKMLETEEKKFTALAERRGLKPVTAAPRVVPHEDRSPSGAVAPMVTTKSAQAKLPENNSIKPLLKRLVG